MSEHGCLYIERDDCGNCYRCVRECSLKALSFAAGRARIMDERCIECGACISWCGDASIEVRNDVHLARKFIKSYSIKVASVSPSWITEFEGIDANRFIEALHLLGFTHVSESALGAEVASAAEKRLVAERGGLCISSRCPAVVRYIHKYKPVLRDSVLPVATPMIVHARMIRSWWGEDARVVHISSCIAAKREASENPRLVEIALTFRELRQWMRNEGVDFDKISGNDTCSFEPVLAKEALTYPLEDGGSRGVMPSDGSVTGFVCSSMENVRDLVHVLPDIGGRTVYMDLMACRRGCAGSNGGNTGKGSYVNTAVAMEAFQRGRDRLDQPYRLPPTDASVGGPEPGPVEYFVAESETLGALASLGIDNEAQQINCNGCGYVTCRRFAKALSRGLVSRQMCVHYVNSDLTAKFTVLLDKMAAGIAMVDGDMKIVEANRRLADMLGPDADALYNSNPGLRGEDAVDVLPFSGLISGMKAMGDDTVVRDVQVRERILTVSIYEVRRARLYLVICRSMHFSQVRNEEIASRARKVVEENLDTVQKIAYLLGENASRTEAILNTILQSQSPADDK